MKTPADYAALVTSQYNDKPNFTAVIDLLSSASCDLQVTCAAMAPLFDLDSAVLDQLDQIGQWVGFTRAVFVPGSGVITLGDADYRTLLRAKILTNHWNGTNAALQTILASLFPGTSTVLFAVDNQDMSMDIYVTGTALSPIQLALVKSGALVPKPEGVRINGVAQITGPLWGLDQQTTFVDGLDIGVFIQYL